MSEFVLETLETGAVYSWVGYKQLKNKVAVDDCALKNKNAMQRWLKKQTQVSIDEKMYFQSILKTSIKLKGEEMLEDHY